MPEFTSEPQISHREADVCFALADPTRINIVHALEKRPHSVNDLTFELGIPQPMTSRHLKILRERGLVYSTRHGVSVTYALSDPRLLQALALLTDIATKPE
jgi:ArsR family transcriptional regulator